MENAQTNPVKKTSKLNYIYVLLILGALVLIGEGVYYFYLKNFKAGYLKSLKKTDKKQLVQVISAPESPTVATETKKYFEGVHYYKEIDGEKRLLFLEGIVNEINLEEKTITLEREGITENVQYQEADLVLLSHSDTLNQEKISFSDIEVGDKVSYNSIDESLKRKQIIWIVQKE